MLGLNARRSRVRVRTEPLGVRYRPPRSEPGAPIGQAPPLLLVKPAQTRCRIRPMSSPDPSTLRRRMRRPHRRRSASSPPPASRPARRRLRRQPTSPSPSARRRLTPPLEPARRIAGRPVEDVRRDRAGGPARSAGSRRSSRSTAIVLDDAGIKRDHCRSGFDEGQPGGTRRRERAAVKGLGLLPADADLRRPLRRAARRPGRRLLRPGRQGALRRVPQRRRVGRPRRSPSPTSTPTRCRTRTSTSRRSSSTRPRRGRPGHRPPGARRGRRDAGDVALAARAT